MPFNDPVASGNVLVRPAVQSPDYVPGVSGWAIKRDGTAEFNGITIRGSGIFGTPGGQRIELSNTGIMSIYSSANELVVQLDATGLTVQDPTSGAFAALKLSGSTTFLDLLPPAIPGHSFDGGQITAQSDALNSDAWVLIESPAIDGGATATIQLFGEQPGGGGSPAQISINTPLVSIGGNPIGLGFVGADGAKANSAAIGTTETAVLTTGTIDFLDDRLYRIEWGANLQWSAAGRANVRIRQHDDAGNLLSLFVPEATATGTPVAAGGTCHIVNTSGATISDVIVMTLEATSGTVRQIGSATTPRYLTVTDLGEATSPAQEISVNLV